MESVIKNLASSLVKAQAEIAAAIKGSVNPHFKSKYADLASVMEAIKPALAKHGLGFVQELSEREGGVYVETVIVHESGETYRTGKLPMPASKQDAHGYGSAISYAKRYSLMAAFGVPAEDDDGNAAVKHLRPEPKDEVSAERQAVVRRVADACIEKHAAGNLWGCYEEAAAITDSDERLMLWSMLRPHSKVRSAIKEYADLAKEKAA